MKIKATLVVGHPLFLNNRFFSNDPAVIRDNQNASYVALKQELMKYDIDLSTEDINSIEGSDIVMQIAVPIKNYIKRNGQKYYLLLTEPPVVNPQNWETINHQGYDRIFTWNDSLVDNKKYFLLRLAYKFYFDKTVMDLRDRKLCTMIVGYKSSQHPLELYSERLAAIKWFSKYHPEDFNFYGQDWKTSLLPDLGILSIKVYPYMRKIFPNRLSRRLFPEYITSYKGTVFSKHETLLKYKFSICYENMRDVPGYITEKIFDSFSAGCVPVYWGASNIAELIPPNCFIERRKFKSYDELYQYISNMDEDSYLAYLKNIEHFISSDLANVFRPEYFAQRLVRYILEDIGLSKIKDADS